MPAIGRGECDQDLMESLHVLQGLKTRLYVLRFPRFHSPCGAHMIVTM